MPRRPPSSRITADVSLKWIDSIQSLVDIRTEEIAEELRLMVEEWAFEIDATEQLRNLAEVALANALVGAATDLRTLFGTKSESSGVSRRAIGVAAGLSLGSKVEEFWPGYWEMLAAHDESKRVPNTVQRAVGRRVTFRIPSQVRKPRPRT